MFEYDTQMVRGRDPDPDVQLHQTARGWAEPSPLTARTVAPHWAPGKCWFGVAQCRCGRSHRTHFCRACGATQYSPRLGDQCLLLAMDERNMRATLRADRDDDQAPPL
jgi:hypothetical protein